jgi:peptidyl-prolyl cis-trans isomerase SurA
MTNLFKILFLFAIITAFPAFSAAEVIGGIAAIVNDEIITTHDVDKEAALLVKEAEKKGPLPDADKARLRETALSRLIDKKLIDQKVRELDIKVSDEELRQAIEDVKKQNKMTQETLVAALRSQGLSFEQYQAQFKEQIERIKLMGQEVRAKIQVGEREIREYYDANPRSFGGEELFHARHIFFRVDKNAPAEEIKKVMATALSALQEARSGKDFAELAKKYSDDPQAAKDGGDLGTFKKGDMLPEIEETVIGMKPGDVSELVGTPAGFHLIKLEERFIGKARPFDEVKGDIEELLYKKKSEERFNQWLADLKKGAAIEIKQ